ncbi:MAG: tautomerase family protein [Verrucomicrobia bacterium]|nr:tautomerase family protein [Verrucomicrobiota bacterium]MBV9657150.1 tautomerase family protein [Verrucomicrobiota bacterium]
MPLVRISLPAGKSSDYRRALGDGVHRALVETVKIPAADRFQVLTEHAPDGLLIEPSYLGIDHTADCVLIQIFLRSGRSVEIKQALYAAIAENLHAPPVGLRKEDVIICLVENEAADWSFGNGVAQYV